MLPGSTCFPLVARAGPRLLASPGAAEWPLGTPGCLGWWGVAAAQGSWVMSTFVTAYPSRMTVSSNKNTSKQGEFSMFIAAIEKIM